MSSSAEIPGVIDNATTGREGILSHIVRSPFQSSETKLHVLLPDGAGRAAECRTLYVLPVEPLDGAAWGNAMEAIREHDLHNKYRLVCVMPTFSRMPWYADHTSDPQLRQESHLLKVVVPFIDKEYPVAADRDGRLLLGFSKSGWGAWSLLLRHPGLFGMAAAWDAPLGQASPNKYGMREVFCDQKMFDRYNIWDLLRERATMLSDRPRLALLGYGDFRGHHQATHYHMMKLGIPHEYRDGPRRKHHWQSGWVPEAIHFLAANNGV